MKSLELQKTEGKQAGKCPEEGNEGVWGPGHMRKFEGAWYVPSEEEITE